jgi:uncharacterized protein YehS (DUF1456 family)
MINNDVLRRLRYALNITDLKAMEIFALAGYAMTRPALDSILRKEDEEGYVECADAVMDRFLEGLVTSRRGKKAEAPRPPSEPASPRANAQAIRLSNNDILKRLRIALELKDEDIIAIMGLAGVALSKHELSALFRKPGHPNFRPCGDQFLRNFLVGLTAKYRP